MLPCEKLQSHQLWKTSLNPKLTENIMEVKPTIDSGTKVRGYLKAREWILHQFPYVFNCRKIQNKCRPHGTSSCISNLVSSCGSERQVQDLTWFSHRLGYNGSCDQNLLHGSTHLSVTKKVNGSTRLCLDPNIWTKPFYDPYHYFMTPIFGDIISRLHGVKWFTIVDVKSGYLLMKLDKKSRELMTFIAPFGKCMFNRVPMGVKSAQDEFQRAMQENLKNILSISEDIIIYYFEKDVRDHDVALNEIFQQLEKQTVQPWKALSIQNSFLWSCYIKGLYKTKLNKSRGHYTHAAIHRWKTVGQLPRTSQLPSDSPLTWQLWPRYFTILCQTAVNSSGQTSNNWLLKTSNRRFAIPLCWGILTPKH